MSRTPDDDTDETELPRRTFLKASGAAAGAGLLGAGATGSAAAHDGFHGEFANWRVREASKVWDRGYRGRIDRPVGLTDSGVEGRHPDLGPWNGIRAVEGENGIELKQLDDNTSPERKIGKIEKSGILGPGQSETGNSTASEARHEVTAPSDAERVDVTLSWTANTQDVDFFLLDSDGNQVGKSINFGGPERIKSTIEGGANYELVARTYASAAVQYEMNGNWLEGGLTFSDFESDVFSAVDTDGSDTTKLVGWYNEVGGPAAPRDGNGHGTHVASIMSGSGRASTVDTGRLTEDEPGAVLVPGDFLEYEVDALAGTGVFASAYGTGIKLEIEGPDGRTIEEGGINADNSLFDSAILDHPTVHDDAGGEATYTVYVKPITDGLSGTPTVGRVQRVAAGAFEAPDEVTGDRVDDGSDPTVHAGVAPNAGILGLKGLGGPTADLGEYAADFAEIFNLRTVNMSWGAVGGLPFGTFGGVIDATPEDIQQMAAEGILTVAAAGNAATPANGNASPASMEEAISVASTDRLDGLVSYSSGGVGAVDEDENAVDRKPDVTAPGGSADGYPAGAYDLARAAKAGDPDKPESKQTLRDYTLKAGTSMASPYACGGVNLVAEAMDYEYGDAPEAIELPPTEEATREDAMRLKGTVLATATESAFTAAPYHHPSHRPSYEFGGRDPYEGYGRINPEVAVDAATRELLDGSGLPDNGSASAAFEETVGLDIPSDQRAVAGHVQARGGTLDVSVEFSHYAGGNKGMTKGAPHVDLFVYDAENPADNGEPTVLASTQATQGTGSVSVDFETPGAGEDPNERVVYVVAKLVNVPGVVNGYDVRAHLDLDVSFEAGEIPDVTSEFGASGSRGRSSTVFTGGQFKRVEVTVDGLTNADAATVHDRFPEGWDVQDGDDVESIDEENNVVTFAGTVTESDVADDGSVSFSYFAQAPEGAENTGQYTFGPAFATVVDPDVPGDDTDGELDGDGEDDVGGSSTARVVGPSTQP